MTRTEHLETAARLNELAVRLCDESAAYDAAGEIVWGATVHAMSAADPEHGTGAHRAPNTARRFEAAANRVANDALTMLDLQACLANNQRSLHNHFYHGDLSEPDLYDCLIKGFWHLDQLMQVSAGNVTASES